MEKINDSGLIIKANLHGNTSQIITLFTQKNGVISGYIKGGLKKNPYVVGNIVEFSWQARIITQLGTLEMNTLQNFSTVFAHDILKMATVNCICEVLLATIKEGDAHEELFVKISNILEKLKNTNINNEIANLYIQCEISLLQELGFGFNFHECNINSNEKPEYISPKTGNAVSASVAVGFEDRLFKIPLFTLQKSTPKASEIHKMLEINLHFLFLHFGQKPYIVREFLVNLFKKNCI